MFRFSCIQIPAIGIRSDVKLLRINCLDDIIKIPEHQWFPACNDNMRQPHVVGLARKFPYIGNCKISAFLFSLESFYGTMAAGKVTGIIVLELKYGDTLSP